jgi:type III restriction enzyme
VARSGEEPKLHLFGQLKRITKQWLDTCLVCKGGTYPGAAHVPGAGRHGLRAHHRRHHPRISWANVPIKALLDPYNPTGLDRARPLQHLEDRDRWETEPARCHVNWVILDSDWEAEFCRVAEAHPQGPGLRQEPQPRPSKCRTATARKRASTARLHRAGRRRSRRRRPAPSVVEIKGYRREDAKEKKSTMETYWVPGVNHLGTYGRWAFAEFTRSTRSSGLRKGEGRSEFNKMIERLPASRRTPEST